MGKRGLAAMAAAALAGCDRSQPAPVAAPAPSARCEVTVPRGAVPGVEEGFDHGDRSLAVVLWPDGRLVAGRLTDGGRFASVRPDGSIVAKLGWWRGVEGSLRVRGARLDAPSAPLRAAVPEGYGPRGFQPTEVAFPAAGCWRVTGTVGDASTTFVVRVRAGRR